eukprot:11449-Heterococcus_DN1.PRE.1
MHAYAYTPDASIESDFNVAAASIILLAVTRQFVNAQAWQVSLAACRDGCHKHSFTSKLDRVRHTTDNARVCAYSARQGCSEHAVSVKQTV